MSYCSDKGIPHSQFLAWDPEDRAKVIAHLLEKAERCDMCGTASWEWDENRFAYEAVEKFCQGCYLKKVYSDQESGSLPGTNVELIPVTPMRRAQREINEERRRRMLTEE